MRRYPGGVAARGMLGSSGSDGGRGGAEDSPARDRARGRGRLRRRLPRARARRARRHLAGRFPRSLRCAPAAGHRLCALRRRCRRASRGARLPCSRRRRTGGAGAGTRRRADLSLRVPGRAAGALRRRGLAAGRGRGLHRLRSNRALVRLRARGRDPGPAVRGQGPRRRDADLGLPRAARGDGGLAALARRGAAHADLPRPSAGLRGGAGGDRCHRGGEAGGARRRDGRPRAPASAPATLGSLRHRRGARPRTAARGRVRRRPARGASLRGRAAPRRDRADLRRKRPGARSRPRSRRPEALELALDPLAEALA